MPVGVRELGRQSYGRGMVATGGRFREILRDLEKPETDADLIGADVPAVPDEFEESGFWLAFDWRRPEKHYRRNPKADRVAS